MIILPKDLPLPMMVWLKGEEAFQARCRVIERSSANGWHANTGYVYKYGVPVDEYVNRILRFSWAQGAKDETSE